MGIGRKKDRMLKGREGSRKSGMKVERKKGRKGRKKSRKMCTIDSNCM